MRLSYEMLCRPTTRSAIAKLAGTSFDTKTNYNIGRLLQILEKEQAHVREEFAKITKDLEKEYILNEKGEKVGEDFKDKELARTKEQELLAIEFDVEDRWGLELDRLEPAKLTPTETIALDVLYVEREGEGKDTKVIPFKR